MPLGPLGLCLLPSTAPKTWARLLERLHRIVTERETPGRTGTDGAIVPGNKGLKGHYGMDRRAENASHEQQAEQAASKRLLFHSNRPVELEKIRPHSPARTAREAASAEQPVRHCQASPALSLSLSPTSLVPTPATPACLLWLWLWLRLWLWLLAGHGGMLRSGPFIHSSVGRHLATRNAPHATPAPPHLQQE